MIQKINEIKNLGTFYNVIPKSTKDCDLKFSEKFTLIFADNGTGKSTIATILKSLSQNDNQRLIEKKTIGTDNNDEIKVSLDIGNEEYIFKKEKWNKALTTAIAVFDEEFINKNVFSSNNVNPENSRALFSYIILGSENIEKAKEVKRLNDNIRNDLNSKINDAETKLKLEAKISDLKILDDFVQLDEKQLEQIEKDIEKNEQIIQKYAPIESKSTLDKISVFKDIPYEEAISQNISTLSLKAEYKTHINKHNAWIEDGVEILQTEKKELCPFCFQNIEENDAIKSYKTFFSQEYSQLRETIKNQISCVETIYNDTAINNISNKCIEENNKNCVLWHSINEEIPKNISPKISLRESITKFKKALKSILEEKENRLLESIQKDKPEFEGLNEEENFKKAIDDYNKSVSDVNEKIRIIKGKTKDIDKLKKNNDENKNRLTYNRVKYLDKKTSKIYNTLKELKKDKKLKEDKIKNLRNEIEKSSKDILVKYSKNINKVLQNFGVEYSIAEFEKKSDSTREERAHFNIELEKHVFNPNGSKDSPYKLSNTLSSGDKSTLAFAFFIAKYDIKNIQNQIFVFDDPITSLDFFRKQITKNYIMKFAEKNQVIILTHSTDFMKLFEEKKGRFVHLMKHQENGVSYTPYNKCSDILINKQSYDYKVIKEYINNQNNDRIRVMRSIRPFLETLLKSKYSKHYFSSLSLGQIINKLKNSEDKNFISNKCLERLKIINKTIVPESHGSDEDETAYANITDNELEKFAKK